MFISDAAPQDLPFPILSMLLSEDQLLQNGHIKENVFLEALVILRQSLLATINNKGSCI